MKTKNVEILNSKKSKEKKEKTRQKPQVAPIFEDILSSIQGIYGPGCRSSYN